MNQKNHSPRFCKPLFYQPDYLHPMGISTTPTTMWVESLLHRTSQAWGINLELIRRSRQKIYLLAPFTMVFNIIIFLHNGINETPTANRNAFTTGLVKLVKPKHSPAIQIDGFLCFVKIIYQIVNSTVKRTRFISNANYYKQFRSWR